MVASSISIATANTILNTIVAHVFREIADELEKADDFDAAVHELIRRMLKEHQRIIFNGDGYSDDWLREAERRGLPSTRSMVDAIPSLVDPRTIEIFGEEKVLSQAELTSRAEVDYEIFTKTVNLEAKTMVDMVRTLYIPAVLHCETSVAASIRDVRAVLPSADVTVQTELLQKVTDLNAAVYRALSDLENEVRIAGDIPKGKEQARYFQDRVRPAMERLRKPVDALELIVEESFWPVPTYKELLFEV